MKPAIGITPEIEAAIEAESAHWAEFFNALEECGGSLEELGDAINGRKAFHRANLAVGFMSKSLREFIPVARSVFLPRISFPNSESYMRAAQAGLLRPGQWIEFEGTKGRFARCNNGGNVVTFYWSTGAKASARGYLKAHGKRASA